MPQRYVYRVQRETLKEPGEDIEWHELLLKFLNTKKNRTQKYQYDLKNGLTRTHRALVEMGITRPYMMTVRAAKTYREQYQAEFGVSDLTVNHMTQKLMTEFTWAYQEEIFATDKLAALKKIEITDKPKREVVKLDEINAIIEAIYDAWSPEHAPASRFRGEEAREFFAIRDVCMTLWMAETGSRVGETARLLRPDINPGARSALLRTTKNGDDRLTFFGADYLNGILSEWLKIRDGIDAACDNLFISELGLPLNPYRWGRQWDRYRQRAGIERRIRRHDLRHFSSQAHDRVSKEASKKQMGHRTDQAHAIYSDGSYSDQEAKELRDAHDQAAPVGPIVARIRAEREAREAAAQPKPARKKVYSK